MKALSIKQPWASLIVAGIKNIENRTWTTHYRGKLLIHASKSGTAADMEAGRKLCERLNVPFPENFPTGGIIGEVEMVGTIWIIDNRMKTDHPDFTLKEARGYNHESFGWILEKPKALPFKEMKGRLGLFSPE